MFLEEWLRQTAKGPGKKLTKKLKNFQDAFIQDSTIVRLHSSLADKFPAARIRKVDACVKLGLW
jgi:putative transposase